MHGEGVIVLLSDATCPGLFYSTPAEDGILSRIRIPGGILDSLQCRAIADIADHHGGGYVDVTNRANIQVREIHTQINAQVLKHLQDIGLGSSNSAVDHIRNIMTSPTAGIDPQELIDTRPFVQGWDNYIAAHPALSGLSAKFSVCFDGGGTVSVRDRLNDITFAAVLIDGNVYFRLYLSVGAKGALSDVGILLPSQCLQILAALADVYLAHIDTTSKRKLRLRELLNTLGCENYLQEVQQRLPFSLFRTQECQTKIATAKYQHIGIHPQRQQGLFYIGVVLPLGRLESNQMRGLADLAEKYGNGIRLTPWQNLLLTDIPQQLVVNVQSELALLGLDSSVTNIKSSLVACSGNKGCAASATDTKRHALALAEYLEIRLTLDWPVNIHFSGCEKSCAQHTKSDITLLGVNIEVDNGTVEGYDIYVGDGDKNQTFGRQLYQHVTFEELPALLERMLKTYKNQRRNSDESFGEFANRYAIAQLKQLLPTPNSNSQIQCPTTSEMPMKSTVIPLPLSGQKRI
ncbi:precorrin-3B synthase [Komarekiella sp. 'clone 1']|uniref:Precorrin-3B synthase n=1 Tax=Komarekiella delphini-convector SJRDD-AB1 TaxID=2593771 RepID=A0AA40VTK4_9NOST|nr:precorrin-3B synthase [Komarekiella delphini-convector SJRDD-AB1]